MIDLPEMMPDLPETAGAHMKRRAVIARKFQISLDLKRKKKRKLWELDVCIASNKLNMF